MKKINRQTYIRKFAPVALLIILALTLTTQCSRKSKNEPHPFLSTGNHAGDYWPTAQWRKCQPEQAGMDSQKLIQCYDYAANSSINTHGLIIIRRGYIVGETYFQGRSAQTRFESYSIAKSFLSSLYGIALAQKHIPHINEKANRYLHEWQGPTIEERKKQITIRHLLTMSSGLQWEEDDYYVNPDDNDVFKMGGSDDYTAYVLAKPCIHEPGTRWDYSSGDSMLLSTILERAQGLTAFQYARQHLLNPIGAQGINWYPDPAGHTVGGWGVEATLRDYARFGYLFLKQGRWDGQQIIPQQWVHESTRPARPSVPWYGYQWWLADSIQRAGGPQVPPDLFLAWGIYTQQLYIIPSHDLVIVRTGYDSEPYTDAWHEDQFIAMVLDAITD